MITIEQAAEAYELMTHYGMSYASSARHVGVDADMLKSKLYRLKHSGYKKTMMSRVRDTIEDSGPLTCRQIADLLNIDNKQAYRCTAKLARREVIKTIKHKAVGKSGFCYLYAPINSKTV